MSNANFVEGWEITGGYTYHFQIREDVRWQNIPPLNGRQLTAHDIVYSYNRQGTSGWPNAPLLQNIEAVEAAGSHVLKITLNRDFPDADFLVNLADGHTKVVSREAVEVNGDLISGPVIGSGPWLWDSTDENIGSIFSKNQGLF